VYPLLFGETVIKLPTLESASISLASGVFIAFMTFALVGIFGFKLASYGRRIAVVLLLVVNQAFNSYIFYDFPILVVIIGLGMIALSFQLSAIGNRWAILGVAAFALIVALMSELLTIVLLDAVGLNHIRAVGQGYYIQDAIYSVFVMFFTTGIISILYVFTAKRRSVASVGEGKEVLPMLSLTAGCAFLAVYIFALFGNTGMSHVAQELTVLLPPALVLIIGGIAMMYDSRNKQIAVEQNYQQQLKFYDEHLQEREASYQHSKILQHDQSQHFSYLLSVMEDNQITEGVTYLKELMHDAPFSNQEVTENFAINSMLSFKNERIRNNQIVLASTIEVPEQVHVSDVDLCIILGNLLDNAIEAATQVPAEKRNIKLEIRYDRENLFISIENPLHKKPRKGGPGGFLSSKRSPKAHGVGLYSVKHSLGKYDGTLQTKVDESKFIATALIYGKKELISQ